MIMIMIMSTSLVISLCFLLLSPVSSLHKLQSSTSLDQGFSIVEKIRLGSTPPSCHNKCNGCHPCMAVQVPTIPKQDPFQPGLGKPKQFFDPTSANQYSNYKPLGWKCRCDDHFYNP